MGFAIPRSLLFTILGIISIPVLLIIPMNWSYRGDPDYVTTKHGKLQMEWMKLAESETFTEYISLVKSFDDEEMTVNILALRNYKKPQQGIYDHSRYVYSSAVMHQSIDCRNESVAIEDLILYAKRFTNGGIVKDVYDLDHETRRVSPGSILEKKIKAVCRFSI